MTPAFYHIMPGAPLRPCQILDFLEDGFYLCKRNGDKRIYEIDASLVFMPDEVEDIGSRGNKFFVPKGKQNEI